MIQDRKSIVAIMAIVAITARYETRENIPSDRSMKFAFTIERNGIRVSGGRLSSYDDMISKVW